MRIVERRAVAKTAPVAVVSARGDESGPASLRGLPVLAYAGIANPEAFAKTLEANGFDLRAYDVRPE